MTGSSGEFGRRLHLALKVLNIGRGTLAMEAQADKSLVSRWVRGITAPRGHYLQVLTRIVAQRAPGFTQLHWEASLEDFQKAIGASNAAVAEVFQQPGARTGDSGGEWLPMAADQSRNETLRDGDRYPGIYVQVRHRFGNDVPLAECIPIWREGDSLRVRFDGPFWAHSGRIFILGQQLFMVAEDRAVSEGLWIQIMNGVNTGKAIAMDGVLSTVPHDRTRAPGSTLTLMMRLEDLQDPYAEPDPDRMKTYQQLALDLSEAGQVADISGPEIIAHVGNHIHRMRDDGSVDHFLRAPAQRGFTLSSRDRNAAVETAILRWRRALGMAAV